MYVVRVDRDRIYSIRIRVEFETKTHKNFEIVFTYAFNDKLYVCIYIYSKVRVTKTGRVVCIEV